MNSGASFRACEPDPVARRSCGPIDVVGRCIIELAAPLGRARLTFLEVGIVVDVESQGSSRLRLGHFETLNRGASTADKYDRSDSRQDHDSHTAVLLITALPFYVQHVVFDLGHFRAGSWPRREKMPASFADHATAASHRRSVSRLGVNGYAAATVASDGCHQSALGSAFGSRKRSAPASATIVRTG